VRHPRCLAALNRGGENVDMLDEGPDDREAAVDLESVRLILDSFTHPTPALSRLIDLVRAIPTSRRLTGSGERQKHRRDGGSRWARVSGVVSSFGSIRMVEMRARSRTQAPSRRRRFCRRSSTTPTDCPQAACGGRGEGRSHNRALSDEELSRARSAIDGGASARAVARDLGVAHTTLLRALKRAWSAR